MGERLRFLAGSQLASSRSSSLRSELGDLNEFRYLFESGDPEYLDMIQQVSELAREYSKRDTKG